MLKTMKKYYKFKKPFYGINCGLIGFLMNKYISNKILKINKSKMIAINPLEIKTTNVQEKKILYLP